MSSPTRPRQDPEPELLRAVLAGQADAVDAWFRCEHPEVFRLCFGFLARRAEADDAAQDAMVHLLDRLHAWDRARSYRSWRTAVVLNHCRDRVRRQEARRTAEEVGARARPERASPDPIESLQRDEIEQRLSLGLSALSPREREAFVLHDLEGLSTAEVARALEVNESSVRSLLTLARRRLRAVFGPELAPEGHSHG